MTEDAEDIVSLRLDVPRDFRTRLKTQSVRLGKKMSDLVEELIDEPLRQLEVETIEKARASSKKPK